MENNDIKAAKKIPGWVYITGIVALIAVVAIIVMVISSGSPAKKVAGKLAMADRYMTELKYEEAIALYKEVLEIEPKSAEAYEGLFEAYMALGDKQNAQSLLANIESLLTEVADSDKTRLDAVAERMRKTLGTGAEDPISMEEKEEITEAEPKEITNYRVDGSIETIEEYDGAEKLAKKTFYATDSSIKYTDAYEYDAEGRLEKVTSYTSDGAVYDYAINSYGDNNQCVMTQYYKASGDLQHVEVFEYDGNGNMAKKTDCYADGSLCSINEYDAGGNLIKTSVYDALGDLNYYYLYYYDESGYRTRVETYDKNEFTGNEYRLWGYMELYYGENGRLERSHDSGSFICDTDNIYEYNEDGSVVERRNAEDSMYGYMIEKYDADGNRVEKISYNEDGSMASGRFGFEYGLKGELIATVYYNNDGSVQRKEAPGRYEEQTDLYGDHNYTY